MAGRCQTDAMSVDEVVRAVIAAAGRREPACGGSKVIAIDGPSGAGKTDLAEQVRAATGAVVLHLDDLYPGWHDLEAAPPMVAAILSAVAVDEVGRARHWDWEADRPGTDITLPPAPLIIVEGVGAAASVVRPFLSLVVWVDAPPDVRHARAIARDGDAYEPWWDVWAAQERRHHARELTRARADLVVQT